MEEPGGLVGIQQGPEALEAPVREVVHVVEAPGRGMGQEEVKASVLPQLQLQAADAPRHLPLCVQILPLPIAERAAQAQNPQTLIDGNPVLRADAALRRMIGKAVVMVAPHVQQGTAGHGDKEFQIGPGQVPTGENQVKFVQLARGIEVIVTPGLHIRYRQNPHGVTPPLHGPHRRCSQSPGPPPSVPRRRADCR